MSAARIALAGAAVGATLVLCLAACHVHVDVTEPPADSPGESTAPDPVYVVSDDHETDPEPRAPRVEPQPPVGWDHLTPCPTEDSENCFWDGAQMGNGDGRSFVNVGGEVIYTDGLPHPATEPPSVTWDEGTLECGHDAKPAIDYSPDTGWWAYCEPALVEEEGR